MIQKRNSVPALTRDALQKGFEVRTSNRGGDGTTTSPSCYLKILDSEGFIVAKFNLIWECNELQFREKDLPIVDNMLESKTIPIYCPEFEGLLMPEGTKLC